jgi:hypothetical protein
MHQKSTACNTCPWLKISDSNYCFNPETLKRTIVADLKAERIQGCHNNQNNMCSGYLSYIQQYYKNGIYNLHMGRIAIALKILNPNLIPKLDTFESIAQMLNSHRQKARLSIPANKK